MSSCEFDLVDPRAELGIECAQSVEAGVPEFAVRAGSARPSIAFVRADGLAAPVAIEVWRIGKPTGPHRSPREREVFGLEQGILELGEQSRDAEAVGRGHLVGGRGGAWTRTVCGMRRRIRRARKLRSSGRSSNGRSGSVRRELSGAWRIGRKWLGWPGKPRPMCAGSERIWIRCCPGWLGIGANSLRGVIGMPRMRRRRVVIGLALHDSSLRAWRVRREGSRVGTRGHSIMRSCNRSCCSHIGAGRRGECCDVPSRSELWRRKLRVWTGARPSMRLWRATPRPGVAQLDRAPAF